MRFCKKDKPLLLRILKQRIMEAIKIWGRECRDFMGKAVREREKTRVLHELAPVYDAHSRVLILGSIPSPKSREAGFYYAHPQNRFWRVISAVFGEPFPETMEERKALAHSCRFALWDVLYSCEICGADDASIRAPVPNDLNRIICCAPIEAIFCTGTKAYSLYNKYCRAQTKREAVLLPSTSPANCRYHTFESLCEAYRVIQKICKRSDE